MDDLWTTILTQAPNFIGFIVLVFVLVKYVIQPGIVLISKLNDTIRELAFKLADEGNDANGQKETD